MALAHAAIRPIREVAIWGRNRQRADATVATLRARRPDLEYSVALDLAKAAAAADVISCVTGAREPVIHGAWVSPGTHTDFFGNHERNSRECDTSLVVRSRVFVDSRVNVLNEAGEILIPISEGRFAEDQIVAELSELCSGARQGRRNQSEITLFKSVGTALSDLGAARLVAQRQ
jgi:1-pyrroline-2-carboxylate reductase [NAD(P)H]